MKTCTKCGEVKPFGAFGVNDRDGLRSNCRACDAAYARWYRGEYPDRAQAADIRWELAHPGRKAELGTIWERKYPEKQAAYAASRRARRLSAPGRGLTAAEWQRILTDAQGKCFYCGKSAPLTRDHVVPLALGGAHDKDNIVAACGACNSSKKNLPLVAWLALRLLSAA